MATRVTRESSGGRRLRGEELGTSTQQQWGGKDDDNLRNNAVKRSSLERNGVEIASGIVDSAGCVCKQDMTGVNIPEVELVPAKLSVAL